ncbi:MAG: hypothetical protein QOE54_278 [Streptosporangiaceae bacterium]|jgi:hypothetical protein|nr:hypothetical protein [Streptosporangiaceae bacterium]MDX6427912.1 hypothetical protein [Streptosporangiaceae bacterium]
MGNPSVIHFQFAGRTTLRRAGRLIFMALTFAILTMFSATSALAYNLEGPKWSGTPSSGCCAHIGVQYSTAWFTGDQSAMDAAVSAWNGSPANVLLEKRSGALTVDDTYDSGVGWDGITYYGWSGSHFTYAHVYLNYYYTGGYPASVVKGVAAHELGHAIGLAHNGGCVLMTPNTPTRRSCGISGPVGDDVNGVNRLY